MGNVAWMLQWLCCRDAGLLRCNASTQPAEHEAAWGLNPQQSGYRA